MEWLARFQMDFNPFTKETQTLVDTAQTRELQTRLDNLLLLKGFGLVTGTPGCGKTTTIRKWVSTLNLQAYKVFYAPLSTITVNEFYRNLVRELGSDPKYRKTDNFVLIRNAIERINIERKQVPILIIDEANHLDSRILSDLKILFNFDMDSRNKAIVIIAGLDRISRTLMSSEHEPLRQRIVMNYHVSALKQDEVRKYIMDKLESAGCHREIFTENAIREITVKSEGIARNIDNIINRSLMLASNRNELTITDSIIEMASKDMRID